MSIVMFNIILAAFGPFATPFGETDIVGEVWEPFSDKFHLGTDHIGRGHF